MMMLEGKGCGEEARWQAVDTKQKENNLMSHDAAGPRWKEGERNLTWELRRLAAIRQNV